MKKQVFVLCAGLFVLFPIIGISGQGYTGPGSSGRPRRQGEIVTAAEAKGRWDDTRVTLQGNIVEALGGEKYLFRDSSGEITLEIDRKIWRNLSLGENDRVEIYGEVDRERRGTEIDVKTITKL